LAQRSRKRGRRQKPTPPPTRAGAKRKAPAPGTDAQQRDAVVRAALPPLRPGERPWAIKVGAVVAFLAGAVQLALYVAGVKLKVSRTHAALGPTVVFAILMFVCAVGMWTLRYWAVLGFMALLGIVVTISSLALIKAANLLGFVIPVAIVAGGGYLFYKLVRVLTRIQMPKYPID